MKLLALFFSLLVPYLALAQGTAIRSLNGDGTNTTIKGLTLKNITASRPAILNANGTITNATGTPDGTKFLRDDGTLQSIVAGVTNVSQTVVGSGSLITYTLTENGFTSGWGGNQPTFIFRDGTSKFEYAAVGIDDVSNNNGKAGQLSFRGQAAQAYGNIAGIHFNDVNLSGDNRGSVIRVKSVSGTNSELGHLVWWGVRYDENAPEVVGGPDFAQVYSSPLVFDSYGTVYLGLNTAASDDPATLPAWITRTRLGKVVVTGSEVGSLPSLVVTNHGGGTNHALVYYTQNPARQTVMNSSGQVAIGTNNTTVQLHVVRDLATNVIARFDDTNYARRAQISTLVGTPAYGAFYLGDVTPTANNFVLTANGTSDTFLNVPSGGNINMGVNGTAETRLSSTALIPVSDQGNSLGDATHRWLEAFLMTSYVYNTQQVNVLQVTNTATIANANATGTKPNLEIPRAMSNSDMGVWQDASILLTNNAAGHAMIQMWLNGAFRGGVRADSAGNNNWHAGSGGYHVFYNGPSPGARAVMIHTNGFMGVGNQAGTVAKEQLEVTGHLRVTNGAVRLLQFNTNPAATNNQAQLIGKTNTVTAAVGLIALDGSGAEYTLTAAVTNSYSGSATLNFASQSLGGVEDLPITVTGAADGDAVSIGVPSGATTGIAGSFTGFASNGVVFVRFVSTAATQDPASGTFKALVHKIR